MSIGMTMLGRNVYSPSAPLIRTTHHLHQRDQIEDHLSISRSQAADLKVKKNDANSSLCSVLCLAFSSPQQSHSLSSPLKTAI